MFYDTRKLFAEAKAVRQKDICAFFAEFLSEISVAEKDVSKQSFGGGNIHIAVFIARA